MLRSLFFSFSLSACLLFIYSSCQPSGKLSEKQKPFQKNTSSKKPQKSSPSVFSKRKQVNFKKRQTPILPKAKAKKMFRSRAFYAGNWAAKLKITKRSETGLWELDDIARTSSVIKAQSNNLFISSTSGAYNPSNPSYEWQAIQSYLQEFATKPNIHFFTAVDVSPTATTTSVQEEISALKSLPNSSALKGIVLHEFHTKWCSPRKLAEGEACFSTADMETIKASLQQESFRPSLYVYTDAKYLGYSLMPGFVLTTKTTSGNWTQMSDTSADAYKDPTKTTSFVSLSFNIQLSTVEENNQYDLSFLFSDNLEKYQGQDANRDARLLVFVNGQYVENGTGQNTSIYRAKSTDKYDYIRIYSGSIRSLLKTGNNTIEVRLACTSTSNDPKCSDNDIASAQTTIWDLQLEKTDAFGAKTKLDVGQASYNKVFGGSKDHVSTKEMVARDNADTLVSNSLDGIMFIFAANITATEWDGVHSRVHKSLKAYLAGLSSEKKSIEVFRHYTAPGGLYNFPIQIDFEQQTRFLTHAKRHSNGVVLWNFPFALYDKFADYVTTPSLKQARFYSRRSQNKGVFSMKNIGDFQSETGYANYSAILYYPRNGENNIPSWFQSFTSKSLQPGSYSYEIAIPSALTSTSTNTFVKNGSASGRFKWKLSTKDSDGNETIIAEGDLSDYKVLTGSIQLDSTQNQIYFSMSQVGNSGNGSRAYFALIKVGTPSGESLKTTDWNFSSGITDAAMKGQYQCFNAFFASLPHWKSLCHSIPKP